jgi:AraC-like DNA-binding protein
MQADAPAASDWVQYRPAGAAGVTLMRAHFTEHAFERHSHPEYGIGLTGSGVQTFNCRGTTQTSVPGDVILLNPDQAHDGLPGQAGGYGYCMLYVEAEVLPGILQRAAGIQGSRHFRAPVVHDPQAAAALQRAILATGQPQESMRGEVLLMEAFVQLLLRHGESPTTVPPPVHAGLKRLQRVRDHIRANADRDLSIGELAREAGVSRVYLSRAFARHFGVPPHLYLNAVRIARARTLLLQGGALAEVAAAVGFADQSHFTRRFKGATGLSPGAWLRQMRPA